jgi:hypothetical protein
MKTKYQLAALFAAVTLALPIGAQTVEDETGIDLTRISPPSPLVRVAQTHNVKEGDIVQVTCHALYGPNLSDGPVLIQYFALYVARQDDARTSLDIVAYIKVEPGESHEFTPPEAVKVVVFGAAEPFLNLPFDNKLGVPKPRPQAPGSGKPPEGEPARPKEAPKPRRASAGGQVA